MAFLPNTQKELLLHFQAISRHQRFTELAKNIMGITRYQILPNFIRTLKREGIVKAVIVPARDKKDMKLYTSRAVDEITQYELAVSMFHGGYFCNLSSVYYHSLTSQIPQSVYICNETISDNQPSRTNKVLTDTDIRIAFTKPSRCTNNIYLWQKHEIIVVDRRKNSDYGVVDVKNTTDGLFPRGSRITCLERTLIDCVVSPQYNGGIASVCSYFRNAQHKKIHIESLMDIYRKLNYVYPYSQAIGFLFDAAGMKKHAAAIYDTFPPKHKFFIDHNAKSSWKFNEKWQIYYPYGLIDEN